MTPPNNPFPTYDDPSPRGAAAYGPPAESATDPGAPPRDPGSKGLAAVSWIAIVALIGLVLFLHRAGSAPSPTASGAPIDPPDATVTLMGRYAVGAKAMAGGNVEQLEVLLTQLDRAAASPADRLRAAVVAGELLGPDAARERIDQLLSDHPLESSGIPGTDPDAEPISAELEDDIELVRAIARGDVVDRDPAARADFIDRHGWFAELALSMGADNAAPLRAAVLARARQTTFTLIGIVFLAVGLAAMGLVVSIFAVAAFAKGKVRSAYFPPSPGGSVYLETFALFLGVFIGVNLLAAFLEQRTGEDFTPYLIWLVPFVAFYPLLRGVPWRRHRYAIGWHAGKGVHREIGAAFVGYLAGLPIVIVGVGTTLLLSAIWNMIAGEGEGGPITHPVMDRIGGGGLLGLLSIYLLAAVWAPLTEESLFRGALQHHLRARLRPFFAALIVGLIFAVVHPQGLLAIPALASLGFVFALMREWRGSAIAPMVAHGLHNGTVVTALWLALS